jgi:hypothetical protein
MLQETELHSDGTTVQVLREEGRDPHSKSCEWVYRTSGCSKRKIVIYDYQETKGQEHPQKFLKDFKGFLHTDGAPAYHNLPPDIIVVGFSTFRFAKSHPSGVRLSCRCALGARPQILGEFIQNAPARRT